MRQHTLLGAAWLLLEAVSASRPALVESLYSAPDGWQRVGEPDSDAIIRLRIALEQPNVSNGKFEETLYAISTPQHPRYGQHLSRLELRELVKPRQESAHVVTSWLRSAGIPDSDIDINGEWVNFKSTVRRAERLLDADFGVYTYADTTASKIRTLSYSVPQEIKSHITMIQPTTVFGRPQRHVKEILTVEPSPFTLQDASDEMSIQSVCSTYTIPACLRALYQINNTTADPNVKTILGISGFLEEYAKHDALNSFLARFAKYATTQNFTTPLVNGGLDDQADTADDDIEANLDMQYAAALGFNTDIRFYSTGGRGPLIPDLDQPDTNSNSDEPYLEYVTYLLSLPDDQLPTTLSTSYGDNEREIPQEYAQNVCNMFGQLGARGVTVLFSSGDSGPGSACQTNDGTNTTRFTPTFPGACPYITSVGGTTGLSPEKAVGFSSGGFSDYFPRPSYQDTAIPAYLATIGDTFSGLFNADGRGFPDVAAQGSGFQVVSQGQIVSVGGTSASAPTFAALVSLVNNKLVAQGRSPLGFMNPWLYSAASPGGGLTDITTGGSRGCAATSQYSGLPTPAVPGAGWNATTGWDPVTGLGTPLFDQLLSLALANTTVAAKYRHKR